MVSLYFFLYGHKSNENPMKIGVQHWLQWLRNKINFINHSKIICMFEETLFEIQIYKIEDCCS